MIVTTAPSDIHPTFISLLSRFQAQVITQKHYTRRKLNMSAAQNAKDRTLIAVIGDEVSSFPLEDLGKRSCKAERTPHRPLLP